MNNKAVKSIALFIPHLGCPHKCVFCNQYAISASSKMPTEQDIRSAVQAALLSKRAKNLEIAFFGGSFTCIGERLMTQYLDIAAALVEKHSLHGIRLSTRPDGIDEKMMAIIKKYPVRVIELGAQSMDDRVLEACERGHRAADTENAARLIKDADIDLVLQMMTGLPCSDDKKDIRTAQRIAELSPSAVRIYPSLVFKGTALAEMYKNGEYKPQSLEQAVSLCKKLLIFFKEKDIAVIKLGLNAESGFSETLDAGPYHPAFRELVEGEMIYDEILSAYDGRPLTVRYNPSDTSKVLGHSRRNAERLEGKKIEFVPDERVDRGGIAADVI